MSANDKIILVVDDEEFLRKGLSFMLKRAGFTVLAAEGGREAYDMVCARRIDLILTDVRMPGGGGVELLTKVKRHSPMLPVIMFLTATEDLSPNQALTLGAQAVFSKPFDRDKLLQQVYVGLGEEPPTT